MEEIEFVFDNKFAAWTGRVNPVIECAQFVNKVCNYKKFFSIVLFALVDAQHKFLFVDVGAPGRSGDSGIFSASTLKAGIDQGCLQYPPPVNITVGTNDRNVEHHIIGDEAFPLQKLIMKPYARRNMSYDRRVFNYRLSRALRVVESAFGILANRFRVFHTKINMEPSDVDNVVLAACSLHNFLIEKQPLSYMAANQQVTTETTFPDGGSVFTTLKGTQKNEPASAKLMRDHLRGYFVTDGSVPWQEEMVTTN